MADSPKRKSEDAKENDNQTAKKARPGGDDVSNGEVRDLNSQINHKDALAYWSSTEPTVKGVLGGYPQVSRVDLQGSSNFLAKLRRESKHFPPGKKLPRAVDCGAGIGRIASGFLVNVAERVDIVEPVQQFTDQIKGRKGIGDIYHVGLEDWHPQKQGLGPYDLIWNQWCVGQLNDTEFTAYLRRLPPVLSKGGWIVVKENTSNSGKDEFDDTDSSVTRKDETFRKLFDQADLKIVRTELQKGMPGGLYPVRTYALQPR